VSRIESRLVATETVKGEVGKHGGVRDGHSLISAGTTQGEAVVVSAKAAVL